jgi:hypothetical protein
MKSVALSAEALSLVSAPVQTPGMDVISKLPANLPKNSRLFIGS